MEKTKLNIGSGYRPMGGEWENLDIRESVEPDIVAPADCIPKPNDYYEEILAHSVLEHFDKRQRSAVLKEWNRILKPGGVITISVPDMFLIAESLVKNYQNIARVQQLINLTYGEQDYTENQHKWGYILETLVTDLEIAGFKDMVRLGPDRYPEELLIRATK